MASQDGGWDTSYKGELWSGPMWHSVEKDLSGWIGHTYRDYLEFVYEDGNYDEEFEMFDEIARVIPNEQLHNNK